MEMSTSPSPRGLSANTRPRTIDTANNAYVEGISNKDWVDDTLMRLRSEELTKTIMVPGNPPAHQTLNSPINSIVAAAKTAHELECAGSTDYPDFAAVKKTGK